MSKRTEFIVSLELPEGVSKTEAARYIRGAVDSMKGCYHPEDPIFALKGDRVRVRHVPDNCKAIATPKRKLPCRAVPL